MQASVALLQANVLGMIGGQCWHSQEAFSLSIPASLPVLVGTRGMGSLGDGQHPHPQLGQGLLLRAPSGLVPLGQLPASPGKLFLHIPFKILSSVIGFMLADGSIRRQGDAPHGQ